MVYWPYLIRSLNFLIARVVPDSNLANIDNIYKLTTAVTVINLQAQFKIDFQKTGGRGL